MRIAASVLATVAAMALGVYVAAALDALAAAALGGRSRLVRSLTFPARRGLALLLRPRARTERPDAEAWALAPAALAGLAAVGLATIPLAPGLAVADADAGIVLFGAAMALVMVAVFLQGWGPNSLHPLIAGYRFAGQALSYEMPLALVLIGAALPAQSLSVGAIVESQAHLWNVIRQPLGMPLFLVAVAGLAFWGPLALPEGEDLAGGTSAEVSGAARLTWKAARLMVLVAGAAMTAAVFLGGWHGPWVPGWAWTILKTLAVLVLLVWARHRFVRVPVERFVWVSWVVLIPLALLDVFLAGAQALWAAP
ncbi:MAG TPA: NADH-quinone oxidoreductase subunit H [Actinomycetota bacterium]